MQMTPQMGYDRAITVFSPDGRLFQVEYAREAVKRGTTAAGVKAKNGVVLLVDKRITSRLIEAESIEKIFQIDDHIGVATSGLVADARALVDRARVEAQVNMVSYDEPIGVEVIAKKICDHKQTYTQYGGVRPYGTALLIAGVDDSRPRLFESDPSGALLEYKATAIGAGRNTFMEIFEADYQEDMDIDAAIMLGMKALYKSTEGKVDAATLELGIVTLEDRQFRKLSEEEVAGFVSRVREELKDDVEEETDDSENEESED
ncbi:MAG: proteasome alpha subunit [Methanolobus sp.]|uniref:Proteasome subunit alpha n=1 Tax=Methanolobus tindarius DSM 2278 TaxID=1090322 RepID=W9DPG9_METTI|nr:MULTISPECIES: archaeal proteasome endopeptidase complex subunit alpha [Methanolobus]ETA67118.1 proteasome endopeptidase complex, archaeal, alpha subunit [Methanolobus tindarius DSM 2278]MDI3485471.1 proteasome alpha subunit [Methanolobus sp.]MDK2832800.1 proteasome alpha subunit [Methanolobus sp.]MDK2939866.1 proteasome alpha subunit [Methanolobus sp.]